ncbi:MAG: hypothetical protein AAF402_06720 [Pseudomonadota bacterium]
MKETDDKVKDPSGKRKTLKALALGGIGAGIAAPAAWQKPVVDSVVLPAHANTTASGGDGTGGTTMAPTTEAPFSGNFFGNVNEVLTTSLQSPNDPLSDQELIARSEASPLTWLISDAKANGQEPTHVCIDVNGSSFSAQIEIRDEITVHMGDELVSEDDIPKSEGVSLVIYQYYTLNGTVGAPIQQMTDSCDNAYSAYLSVNSPPAPSMAGLSITFAYQSMKNSTTKIIDNGPCTHRFGCGSA